MSNQTVETLDTSQMQILAEFPASEVINNIVKFRIGLVSNEVIIAACGKAGIWSGELFFERSNAPRVVELLGDVMRGKIAQADENYISFKAGKDLIGVGEYAPRGTLYMTFSNARRGKLDDGLELGGFTITTEPNTLLRMKVELERLVEQGKL